MSVTGIFDNLEKSMEEKRIKNESNPMLKPIDIKISSNPHFNTEFIISNLLSDIDVLKDNEISEMLKLSYTDILKRLCIDKDINVLKMFMSPRFVNIFVQSITNIAQRGPIDNISRVYCNRLAYDYFTGNIIKDDNLKNLFLSLSKAVNQDVLPGLKGLGLDDGLSSLIALSMFSDFHEHIAMRRVNAILIHQNANFMTVQKIVDIYSRLTRSATTLFKAMMFDIYSDEELLNISNDAETIYGNISLAVLAILEQIPSQAIEKVLMEFVSSYGTTDSCSSVRFSMRAISPADYPRITNAVNILEQRDMLFMPTGYSK